MKLVVNMLFGTMLAGLAETLALGEKVGLQQEQILEILSLLPISSKLNLAKGDGLFTSFSISRFIIVNQPYCLTARFDPLCLLEEGEKLKEVVCRVIVLRRLGFPTFFIPEFPEMVMANSRIKWECCCHVNFSMISCKQCA